LIFSIKKSIKMKILHIHSDRKFIIDSFDWFNDASFENTIIYLGEPFQYDKSIDYIPFSKRNAYIIASKANQYDVVIFYSLRLEHAIICGKIERGVIVLWRFFGGELYQLMGTDLLSSESKRYYKKVPVHHFLSVIKNTLLYSSSAEEIFRKAVLRSEYFMGLSDMEYAFLKKKFQNLPPFIQLPYTINAKCCDLTSKEDIVILGHSRDIYGNHLEVLKRLESGQQLDDFNYVMFFSYGEYSEEYTKAVLDIVRSHPTIRVISDFLDRNDYFNILNTSAAMVINSYRQMGMGNVFLGLMRGIKVYLNEKNVMYDWLRKEGFAVYSVESFYKDISNRDICLSKNQTMNNIDALNNLAIKYSVEGFCERVLSLKKYE